MPVTSALRKNRDGRSKIDGGRADPLPDQPVGQAGHSVWFKRQSRHAPHQRRQHRRPGSIAAHPDHHLRLPAAQKTHAVHNAARECNQRLELGSQADAVKLADIDEFQGEPGLRHQARLHSLCCPDETDFRCIRRLEGAGDCQRGDDVSTRAAAGNHDPHAVSRSPG